MNRRASKIVAVGVLGALASLTSCSSAGSAAKPAQGGASPVVLASPDAATISTFYLQPIRTSAGMASGTAGKQFAHFAPGQSSDAKLIAVGKEACTDLQGRKPAEVMALLKQEGWTGPEAVEILTLAANPDTFCPGEYQAVDAWVRAASAG